MIRRAGTDDFAEAEPPSAHPGRPLTLGLVGSSIWIPSRQTRHGWELVKTVRLLKHRMPVRGKMIGDGIGINVLKDRCAKSGLTGMVEFAGRVPYADLPERLRDFDIALSTQTDDVIGRVRTTGRLPRYLAAGRFVLASRVGEAARVLPPETTVKFRGRGDLAYPSRLAARIAELAARGTDFSPRPELVPGPTTFCV